MTVLELEEFRVDRSEFFRVNWFFVFGLTTRCDIMERETVVEQAAHLRAAESQRECSGAPLCP